MSNTNKARFYNKKVLVDTFQLRFVGVGIFHFVIVVLIFAAAIFAPVVVRLMSGDISSPFVQAAAREFLVLHGRVWLPLLGAFVLLVLHNILVTHRVAGPLFRFRRYLTRIGDGDLSAPIRIRKGDYLQKEAQAASRMVESLRDKVVRLEGQFEAANDVWKDLRRALADAAITGVEPKINAMNEHLEDCMASVSVFDTGNERTSSATEAPEASGKPVEVEA
jgi:methyl-accepting chemotaxis protein